MTRVPAPQRARARAGAHLPEHRAVPRHDRARQHQARPPLPPARPALLDALFYLRAGAARGGGSCAPRSRSAIIDFLEIDHIRHAPVAALPYGLQKRVELARALAMRPRVLHARRAGRRHEPRGDRGHGALHPRRAARMGRHGADGRARHGHGDGPLRPRRRAQLRPGHRPRHARPRCRPIREVIGAYLGSGDVARAARASSARGAHSAAARSPDATGRLAAVRDRAGRRRHAAACTRSPALAFVLIYKATRVVNFAIGEMLMIGAYVFFAFAAGLGLPVWLAIPLALAVSAAFGARGRAHRDPADARRVADLGRSWSRSASARSWSAWWSWSGRPTSSACPSSCRQDPITIGEACSSPKVFYGFWIAVVLIVAVLLVFRFWRGGVALRATASDQAAAYSMGIDVPRVFSLAWVAAAMIAGGRRHRGRLDRRHLLDDGRVRPLGAGGGDLRRPRQRARRAGRRPVRRPGRGAGRLLPRRRVQAAGDLRRCWC